MEFALVDILAVEIVDWGILEDIGRIMERSRCNLLFPPFMPAGRKEEVAERLSFFSWYSFAS